MAAALERSDPEHPTTTHPRRVQDIDPLAALQGRGGADAGPGGAEYSPWLPVWLRTAAWVVLALAVVLAPAFVIVAIKAVRRRRRRRGPASKMAEGGWEEYVDGARDAGVPVPRRSTRRETARALATSHGLALAHLADLATFTRAGVEAAEAERMWDMVERDRAELRARRRWWRRLGTRLSMRSLAGREPESPPAPVYATRGGTPEWKSARGPSVTKVVRRP